MTPTFDPARAESYVRSFQKASEMTGYGCCTANEEQAASEAFLAWARSLTLANPLRWATAVETFGLPMDDIPAVWQGEWAEKTLAE